MSVPGVRCDGQKVALICHDPILLSRLAATITQGGPGVHSFPDADSALEHLARSDPPHLIVIEIELPAFDGWRLCRLLRSPAFPSLNSVPVLMISSTFSGTDAAQVSAHAGADAFLPMPTEGSRFLDTVHALLHGDPPAIAPRLLIVSSDPQRVDAILGPLGKEGYGVEVATGEQSALEAFAGRPHEVVLLDADCLGGSVESLMQTMLPRGPLSVYLVLAKHPQPAQVQEWMRLGAAAHAPWPLHEEELVRLCLTVRRERALLRTAALLDLRNRQLQESEAHYRALVENSPDIVMRLDGAGRILYASPGLAGILHIDSAAPVGKTFVELGLFRGLCSQLENDFAHVMETGDPVEREFDYPEPDGETSFELRLIPEREAGGTIRSVLCVARDVTEKKKVERERELALREQERSEREKSLILDSAGELFVYYDRDLRVQWMNRPVREAFGLSLEEVFGRRCYEIWRGRQSPCDACPVVRARDTRTPQEGELVHEGGRVTYSRGFPVLNADGEVEAVIEFSYDITEKKRAEQELTEALSALESSEERLRLAIEATNDGLWDWEVQRDVSFWSANSYRMLGYEPDSFIVTYETWRSLVHPDDWPATHAAVQESLQQGVGFSTEYRIRTRENGWKWIMLRGRPVAWDDMGQVLRMAGTHIDIDARVRSELAVRESEERFRTLIETSPEAIFVQTDKRFAYLNVAALQLFGAESPAELLGQPVMDRFHPKYRPLVAERIHQLNENREAVPNVEQIYLKLNGSPVPVEVSAAPLTYEGRPGAVVFARDITDRKWNEEQKEAVQRALQQSEEKFRTIFSRSADAHLVLRDGVFSDCNEAALDLFFAEEAEAIIGRTPADLSPERQPDGALSAEKASEYIEEALRAGSKRFEWVHSRPDGSDFWVEVVLTATPIDGLPSLFVTWRDITERKQGEAIQAQLEAQLLQARKLESVGQLAGGVAHDLNNMLTPILGYAELLRSETPKDHPHQSDLGQIVKAAERARDLVRQLLAFARKQTLEMHPLDLNGVVLGFESMLRRTIREDVSIELFLAPDLGVIEGDIGQLEQVILNLAVNAQDAMPAGGHLVIESSNVWLDQAYVERHQEATVGPHIMLAISDTGVGMDRETLERIFDPFFTTKEQGKGTGLGMATVYGIVKQHRGTIWAYSEPGKGSTFRLYFPQTDMPLEEKIETGGKRPAAGRETVLVVEDEEQVRALTVHMLRSCGYTVLQAESGSQALEVAASYVGPIELLVTDVVMPGMNGKELYRRLRESRVNLKVLFVSGYTSNVISHHGVLDAGMHYMQKPFSLNAFAHKVRQALDTE